MKRRMKPRLAALALVALILCLTACAASKAPPQPKAEPTVQAQPTAAPTPTPEPTPAPTPARVPAGYAFNEPAEFTLDLSDLRMKAPDGSYISMLLTKSDEDVTARTEAEYLDALTESYAKEGEADITLQEYERMEIDGAPGLHAVYVLGMKGGATRHVLERILQVGGTVYRVRYTDMTGKDRWMETFRKSGDTVQVMWEDEADARDMSKLVLYDAGDIAICMPKKMTADSKTAAATDVTVFYYSDAYMMSALREGFADYMAAGMDVEAFTLADYAKLIADANGIATPFAPDRYGNLAVTYTNTIQSGTFFYYTTLRKGSDAFWVINFACLEAQKDEYLPQFELWADSIMVD